ncbi:carbohydrate binding domain-containing protein [Hymenobacter cheonanensis]|uniref:carbohydrate binding domain-containing protein n=1 Tax=Hymenobacter sp. CA2-7 TaxID=3063993 RepID=UPI00271245AB|nr:carbohydrate binding domain-containing protein [Hymenobacter sp. CA2-7]MDO7884703.1 carbohydrate binding domain-containing protein [Hymenobacter sp. CA2-7]
MNYLLLALLGATALSACSRDAAEFPAPNALMHNDFESAAGWVADATSLSTEQAHSGKVSLKVDPTHPYSLTYYSLLGQLSEGHIRGVRVEAWAYAPSHAASANVRLSIGLNDAPGGQLMLGDGIPFSTAVTEDGKWVKVSKDFIFPPKANYSSQLVMYLWNGGGTGNGAGPAYLDDIQLTAIE